MQGFIITTSKGDIIKSAKVYTHFGIAKAARRTLFGWNINRRLAKEYGLSEYDDQLKDAVDNELRTMYPIIRIDVEAMRVERVGE